MSRQRDLFAAFLQTGDTTVLPPRERTVAEKLAQGQSLGEVGQSFAVTRERIRQIAAKAERRIKCYYRKQADREKTAALVDRLKTSDQSARDISIDAVDFLIPFRLWYGLKNAGVNTLGDIVDKGRWGLFRCHNAHIGTVGMAKLAEVLGLFGLELPE